MRSHKVTVQSTGQAFEVQEGERILAAARRAGIWLPFECGWGSCATCKVDVLEGDVQLLYPDAPAVTPRDARRNRVLTCQTTVHSDVVIKASKAASSPPVERPTADYHGRLSQVERLSDDVSRFVFELNGVARFREGQYAILDLGDGVRRCYSMANLCGGPTVEFIAKRYPTGVGSERLFALPIGTAVPMELPYGDMWLRQADRPLLLIAGGTGISAILALLHRLCDDGDQRETRVYYGARSIQDLVCWDEVVQLTKSLSRGSAHATVVEADPDWAGATGLVTDLLADQLADGTESDTYLAGPPPMVDSVLSLFRDAGGQLDRMHYDRFG